jgi:acetyl esterase/lipase
MKAFLTVITYLAALLSAAACLRPRSHSATVLLWLPKLMAGALSPILGLIGGLGTVLGLARRDWKLAGAGILGTGFATQFLRDIPDSHDGFSAAFGPGWPQRLPASLRPALLPRRWSLLAPPPAEAAWQRNVVYGKSPGTGAALLADLWQPPTGAPRTGLGVIYVHGGGWRIGGKDLGTRPFFRRLAGQGHVVLDIAYTLWPQSGIPAMVSEVKQAVLWLKEHAETYSLDPKRIVLMGGSAGGHLVLLTAYTPGHPAFPPPLASADTSVRGVIAFYPPTDFLAMQLPAETIKHQSPALADRVADGILRRLFMLHDPDLDPGDGRDRMEFRDLLPAILGGQADEIPETYRLLSPIGHVSPDCPPTLLLQGSDDVFGLAPTVRQLHQSLQEAGAPSILVEFPHTEHAFDLLLPRISPVAQAAIYDVERFLALLV